MRINLLPAEILERQRVRRTVVAVALVGILLLAAMGVFFFLQTVKLKELNEDIAAQEVVNDQLRAQIAELQQFETLQQELVTTRALLESLLADEVRWSGILRDISLVIPSNVWLTQMTGAIAEQGTTTPAAEGLIGQISFQGAGLTNHRSTALWLTRLEDVEGFANPWASVSQKAGTSGFTSPFVEFTSTVDLTGLALVRAPGGQQ